MSNRDVKGMSKEDIKKEHRDLQRHLENLREEREGYEPTETTGSRQTQEGSRNETRRIDEEMDDVRRRQKELYNEHQNRK